MDINMKLIGKRIKHRREVSGLSQEQLAEKLDLSTNHISSMECGKSLLTTKCLLAVNGKIKYTNFGHEKYTTLRH